MSSTVNKGSDRLVGELRESIDSQLRQLRDSSVSQHARHDSAFQLLNRVVSFLQSWDELQTDHASNFPSNAVRDALHSCLAEMGPGDAKVRAILLEAVSSLSTNDTRQAVLDVMPWTMPTEPTEHEEATNQILDSLRDVLQEDAQALLPVLGCLKSLPLSPNGRAEAWDVALSAMPVVSESDLPVLVRTLLCNVTNEEDASRVLEALRAEFELLQSTESEDDDPIPLLSHVLEAFQDRENGALISKAYIDILSEVSTLDIEIADDSSSKNEPPPFLLLDAVAVLALYQDQDLKVDVENLMDEWIEDNSFPFASFRLLLDTLFQQPQSDMEPLWLNDRLVPALLSLAIFLLVAPVRTGKSRFQQKDVHVFIIELHRCLDVDNQNELVQRLLHLSEEASHAHATKGQVHSHENLEIVIQHEGLKVTTDAIYSLLQQLARISRSSVARFKDKLVERLLSLTNEDTSGDPQGTQDLCSLLSSLVEPKSTESARESGFDTSEMMVLLHKLLFTSSRSSERGKTGEFSLNAGRVIQGLILSIELVQSEAFSRSDKECIHQWVHRILLPSTRRTVDPEIGSHGLRFLSAWSTWLQSAPAVTIATRPTDNEIAFDKFQSFKMILANTGLIQTQSLYLERRRRPDETVLGYTSIPASFLTYVNPSGRRNKRSMIFCIFSYVRVSNAQHPSRWGELTSWVYNLVDMYLTMGREGTKTGSNERNGKGRPLWLPDGWLEASLELPNLNLAAARSGRKTKNAEMLSNELCSHEVSFDSESVPKYVYSEVANGLCDGQTVDQMHAQVESVLQLTLSFLLGAGLSAAVLRNTYSHLLSLDDVSGDEEGLRRRRELVKLIQYQVMKLYDLRRKTETSICLLEALDASLKRASLRGGRKAGDAARRRSRNVAFQKISLAIATACQQTEQVLSRVFSNRFIDAQILVRCLVDPGDEATLLNCLKVSPSLDPPMQFKMVVELRKRLLGHLLTLFPRSTTHGVSIGAAAMPGIASVIKTATTVSRMLPAFRKALDNGRSEEQDEETLASDNDAVDLVSMSDVSALSSSYFRMVKMILTNAMEGRIEGNSSMRESDAGNGDQGSTQSFFDVIVNCFVESNGTGPTRNDVENESNPSVAFNYILRDLCACEDTTTVLELLDILSLLSSNDSELNGRAIEACWRVLHTAYNASNQDIHEPILRDDLPQTFQKALESASTSLEMRKVLSATIVRTATAPDARNGHELDILRRTFLLLWSLASQEQYLSAFDCWCKVTTELVRFLDVVDGSSNADEELSEHESNDRSQRLQCRGKRVRSRPAVSSIPSLTLDTFGAVYECVLYASIATFAVSPHALTDGREAAASPFQHHHDMVRHIGRLLDLYLSRFDLLPRRIMSVVLACCKQLLKVFALQVDGCVVWRNAQPILSMDEKRAGVHDYGSIKFLEQLLRSFSSWGAGKVLSFAQRLRRMVSPYVDSDSDESREPFATVPQHDKRITSLMLSARRTIDTLRDVAEAHNLEAPRFDSEATDESPFEEVQVTANAIVADHADKGYHELDKAELNHSVTHEHEGTPKRKRRRVAPTLISTKTSAATLLSNVNAESPKARKRRHPVIEEDEYDWGDDMDSEAKGTTDGFGVSGKWGDEEEAEEDSSSGSLELEVSDIFQAK